MRILGCVGDFAAQGMYRIILPLINLKEQGLADVQYTNIIQQDEVFWADIIILQRQHNAQIYEILPKMIRQGKTLIYELDDNLHAVRPTSTAYATYNSKTGVLPLVHKFMNVCQGMTVTRTPMKEVYKSYNKNIKVIPNFMDLRLWDTPKVNNGKDIVIGWSGSATHYEDLKECSEAICQVVNKYDNVKFAIGGYFPQDLFKSINDKDKVLLIPPKPFYRYSEVVANFDISLCPIHDNPFNDSKSNIKYLEASLLGIPTIASNAGPYKDTITHGVNGLLVKKPRFTDWVNALENLIQDENKRIQLGKVANEYVRDVWDIKKNAWRWRKAFEEIKEGVI